LCHTHFSPAAAMGLPVSGFPNMNAVALEDATGQTFVATGDFLATGVPSSFAATGVVITLGYALMRAVGF
jgi:phosphate transporter